MVGDGKSVTPGVSVGPSFFFFLMALLPRTTERGTLKKIVVVSSDYVVFIVCETARKNRTSFDWHNILYSDTSANEDNSFRNQIR